MAPQDTKCCHAKEIVVPGIWYTEVTPERSEPAASQQGTSHVKDCFARLRAFHDLQPTICFDRPPAIGLCRNDDPQRRRFALRSPTAGGGNGCYVNFDLAHWNIIYQSLRCSVAASAVRKKARIGGNHGCKRSKCFKSGTVQQLSLDATYHRRRLHGDDCQSSVWLDLFRRPDGEGQFLGHRGHPGRIQHLRRAGNLADAG